LLRGHIRLIQLRLQLRDFRLFLLQSSLRRFQTGAQRVHTAAVIGLRL